jgi:hypothetical protein
MKCSENLTLLQFWFQIRLQSSSERENKIHFSEANTPWYRTTPCPRDASLKNDSRQKGEREHTYKKIIRQSLSN